VPTGAAADATIRAVPHLVAAPDKFRETASSVAVAEAIGRAAAAVGWSADLAPVADGGEGFLDALLRAGGSRRTAQVTGPLGRLVTAEWGLIEDGHTAVVEMARASGLELAGGPQHNDPLRATTAGTGELIAAAVSAGARRVLVGLGGSATTDGGLPCLRALSPHARLRGVELIVACDVTTRFVDAARVFGPQKGASDAQVALLTRRLERLVQVYRDDFGVDVSEVEGSGAAGGLAGGLVALGARLVPGFEVVAEAIGLEDRLEVADLVVTGEGWLDEQSFRGKAVGGVLALADAAGVSAAVIVGGAEPGAADGRRVISLTERYGEERSRRETVALVEAEVQALLR
jgi:glycerate kinase